MGFQITDAPKPGARGPMRTYVYQGGTFKFHEGSQPEGAVLLGALEEGVVVEVKAAPAPKNKARSARSKKA